jgi:hypothetical protein
MSRVRTLATEADVVLALVHRVAELLALLAAMALLGWHLP